MNQREIKFRAWDKEREQMFTSKHFKITFDGYVVPNGRMEWNPDQFVLEQFTGLHDKNGKEIYEGDLLVYSKAKDKPIYWKVSWYQDRWLCKDNKTGTQSLRALAKQHLVIGNIHKNPDLLK